MKYLIQPNFTECTVSVHALLTSGAELVTTLRMSAPDADPDEQAHPNCTALYRDVSQGTWHLFVSFDVKPETGKGFVGVKVFDFSDFSPLADSEQSPVPTSVLPLVIDGNQLGTIGLAVQPGTGDLFIATYHENDNSAGLRIYRRSDYAAQPPNARSDWFADGSQTSVTQISAALAFDRHGFLWSTTYDAGEQFLVCYRDPVPGQQGNFVKVSNHDLGMISAITTLPGSTGGPPLNVHPFSAPEGLAFDPDGNLWVANNNESSTNPDGDGTVIKITRLWLDKFARNETEVPGSEMTAYYLRYGKFGGLAFDGYTMFLHDQSSESGSSHRVTWRFDTSAAVLDDVAFRPSGVPVTYPGNGGISIFNPNQLPLLITDELSDSGVEPDTKFIVSQSPDIGVSNSRMVFGEIRNTPFTTKDFGPHGVGATFLDPTLRHGSVKPGRVWVNVKVRHQFQPPRKRSRIRRVAATTTGTEVLRVYWAKNSDGLDWPQPWDGTRSQNGPPTGGEIGMELLGQIDAGHFSIFEFAWDAPDPASFADHDPQFTILARVETEALYPYGMTHPEQVHGTGGSAISANVRNNRTVAWLSFTIA